MPLKIKANFSSIGPSFDNRVKPEVMAQGVLVFYLMKEEI
jgi:hypothetical protein